MAINRRWDPAAWEDDDACWLLTLAADYGRAGNRKPWWMGDNALELWRGPSFDELACVERRPRQGTIWTAPSVFEAPFGRWLCCAGLNEEGPIPQQSLLLLDAQTLNPAGELPAPPRQYQCQGRAAWRDARIQRVGDEWWLTVTTGGFRWACPPNVLLYRTHTLGAPWWLDTPLLDPGLACLFGELERPQLHPLPDGRWCLVWSTWADRHFMGRNEHKVHFAVSAGPDPIISRYLGTAPLPYGLAVGPGDLACGWDWIDRPSYTSTALVWTLDEPISALVAHLEANAHAQDSLD